MKTKPKNCEEYFSSLDEETGSFFRMIDEILISNDLLCTIKWGIPTYTYRDKNYIGLASFKNFDSIWFHYGAFLSDSKNLLENSQEGKTKYLRTWKVYDKGKDFEFETFESYVKEAVDIFPEFEKIKPSVPKKRKLENSPELEKALAKDKEAKEGFESLTPIAQSDYAEYINTAKRDSTKQTRLQKIIPLLREGKPIRALYS